MTTPADRAPRLVATLPSGLTKEYMLRAAGVTIGRHPACDIVLDDSAVSQRHARVERTDRGLTLTDLGSSNGTRVNGERTNFRLLAHGDVVHLGDCVLRFEINTAVPGGVPRAARATLADVYVPPEPDDETGPCLTVHTPDRTWEVALPGDRLTIGREADNDVVLEYPGISRYHAVVEQRDALFAVRDLNSRNGTWVGTARITRTVLNDSESFRIGLATFVLKVGSAGSAAALAPPSVHGARRPVVVIPGFAGSNLWSGGEQVWPSLKVLRNPELLRIERPLEPRGIVNQVVVVPGLFKLAQYSALTDYLREALGYEAGRDLLEFAYDFRQDNRRSAALLAAQIEQWKVSAPITIIAHSMGCLIARYYIERLGGKRTVERVVLVGGPHAGTPYAFAGLLSGLNLLPLGMMDVQWRERLATLPSWYQILPTDECISTRQAPIDVLTDDSWVRERHRPLLHDASRFRQELGAHSSVPAVCIFGYGVKTIAGAVVERTPAGEMAEVDFRFTDSGDGTIPEHSAMLRGAEIHPVRQQHGSLYVDEDVQRRLKLELTRPVANPRVGN